MDINRSSNTKADEIATNAEELVRKIRETFEELARIIERLTRQKEECQQDLNDLEMNEVGD